MNQVLQTISAPVLTALLASVAGGWIGAMIQARRQRTARVLDMLWDLRIRLYEPEVHMWNTDSFAVLNASVNYLRVGVTDPRIQLPLSLIDGYGEAIEKAFRDRQNSVEMGDPDPVIATSLLNEMREARVQLDETLAKKIKRLDKKFF